MVNKRFARAMPKPSSTSVSKNNKLISPESTSTRARAIPSITVGRPQPLRAHGSELYSSSSSPALTAAFLPFLAPLAALAFFFFGASATSSSSSSSTSAAAAAFLPFFSLAALVVFFFGVFGTSWSSSSPAPSSWSSSSASAAAALRFLVAAPSEPLESMPPREKFS